MTEVPLLNQYKYALLRRRLLQVITGGVNIRKAPLPVHLLQLSLWTSPVVLAIPFIVIDSLSLWNPYYTALVYATAVALCVAVLEASVVLIRHRHGSVLTNTVCSDEDNITEFNTRTKLDFVFSSKQIHSLLVHPLLAGLVSYSGCLLLLPSVLQESLSVAGVVAVFTLGWLTQATVCYSLAVRAPTDIAAYRATDKLELKFIYRPFYVILLASIFIAVRSLVLSPGVYLTVLHSCHCLLPLGWATGVLPPLEPLTVWAMEQTLPRLMGGSTTATDFRLVVQCFLSLLSVGVLLVLTDDTLALLLAATFGHILSKNLFHILNILALKLSSHWPALQRILQSPAHTSKLFTSFTGIDIAITESLRKYILNCGLSVIQNAVKLCVQLLILYFTFTTVDKQLAMDVVGGVSTGLFVMLVCSDQLQSVYLCGVVRNPLYPWETDDTVKFKLRRKILFLFALPRAIVIKYIAPVLLLAYIGLAASVELPLVPPIWAWIVISRALRMVWQKTYVSLMEFSLVALLQLAVPSINTVLMLGPLTQALLAGEMISTLQRFTKRLSFIALLFFSFISKSKYRTNKKVTCAVITLNVIAGPFLVPLVLLSSVMNVPLLPLFTLPVFMLSFPRGSKFWPGLLDYGSVYSQCDDSVYYQQSQQELLIALHKSMLSGALSAKSGTQVLMRFEDRMVLATVLETGMDYKTLALRGLELQETSCHTTEANKVDEIFESMYSSSDCCRFAWNTNYLNILQPTGSAVIKTYSDAKNVLTGIIDQSSSLERFSENLYKTLTWILFNHYKQNNRCAVVSSDGGDPALPEYTAVDSVEDNVSWAESVSTEADYPQTGPRNIVTLDNSIPSLLPEDRPLKRTIDIFISPSHDVAPVSAALEEKIPGQWSSLPLTKNTLSKLQATFPKQWLDFIKSNSESSLEREEELCDLVTMCYSVLDVPTATSLAGHRRETTSFDIHQGFNGEFVNSSSLAWLTSDSLLLSLALKAFRYSVRLLYDEASLGDIESCSELCEYLRDYDTGHYIGPESGTDWSSSVLQQTSSLFSIGRDIENNVYTGHVLSLQDQVVHIGELNEAAVDGIWADLSMELLFLTNDDEERYSIQAHTEVLRNLVIQAANPPLGYNVFASGLKELPN